VCCVVYCVLCAVYCVYWVLCGTFSFVNFPQLHPWRTKSSSLCEKKNEKKKRKVQTHKSERRKNKRKKKLDCFVAHFVLAKSSRGSFLRCISVERKSEKRKSEKRKSEKRREKREKKAWHTRHNSQKLFLEVQIWGLQPSALLQVEFCCCVSLVENLSPRQQVYACSNKRN